MAVNGKETETPNKTASQQHFMYTSHIHQATHAEYDRISKAKGRHEFFTAPDADSRSEKTSYVRNNTTDKAKTTTQEKVQETRPVQAKTRKITQVGTARVKKSLRLYASSKASVIIFISRSMVEAQFSTSPIS